MQHSTLLVFIYSTEVLMVFIDYTPISENQVIFETSTNQLQTKSYLILSLHYNFVDAAVILILCIITLNIAS